ncbi:MAG: bifunctional UDP-N-acetylglucosamine diphosphorylase/glucosamine-1-phosphate N-acetyltransferase GlmU [Clostridia bacterium]|nr:bifunctional UDP-N-acetylglucosamine diphosphorylase/glucosamine-1-phosphate N-acetyltransferase GlmU [Clostridia bacterium]
MSLAAVILAAGKGTRMKSSKPKVLHEICGVAMVDYVLDAAYAAGADKVVVVAGFGYEQVLEQAGKRAEVVLQAEQLGTAHALLQAKPILQDFSGDILVLCGDTPLIQADTLKQLVAAHQKYQTGATVLTAHLEIPFGYGRIIRDGFNDFIRIVEQKDATEEEASINEINTGMYCFAAENLFDKLGQLQADNAQGEYYLTDIMELYRKAGQKIQALPAASREEILGVNDRIQLAKAEVLMRHRLIEGFMLDGVTILDPSSTYINKNVIIGRDTIIYPNTFVYDGSMIGENCIVGPNVQLFGAKLGQGVKIRNALVEDSVIGDRCTVGPFSYIRPGCVLAEGVKIGDFVELKKTSVAQGSKVPHLSYVGDTEIGRNVNIGAGTITCNYDGKNKWPTIIEDGAFIGSNSNLVAPVRIGAGAVTGAGSTITKDVPSDALALTREQQKILEGWSSSHKK